MGFSAFEKIPGRPLALMWYTRLHKRKEVRFVPVTLGYKAPRQKGAPSEPALPSALLAPGLSSCRRAIFSFPEAFTERMENPFQ